MIVDEKRESLNSVRGENTTLRERGLRIERFSSTNVHQNQAVDLPGAQGLDDNSAAEAPFTGETLFLFESCENHLLERSEEFRLIGPVMHHQNEPTATRKAEPGQHQQGVGQTLK